MERQRSKTSLIVDPQGIDIDRSLKFVDILIDRADSLKVEIAPAHGKGFPVSLTSIKEADELEQASARAHLARLLLTAKQVTITPRK